MYKILSLNKLHKIVEVWYFISRKENNQSIGHKHNIYYSKAFKSLKMNVVSRRKHLEIENKVLSDRLVTTLK